MLCKERTTRPETMTDPPPISDTSIQQILAVGGTDLLQELKEVFHRTIPERIAASRRAAARGDLETVAQEMHALRSGAANMGALPLRDLAETVEIRARNRNTAIDDVKALLDALEHQFRRAADALEAQPSEA